MTRFTVLVADPHPHSALAEAAGRAARALAAQAGVQAEPHTVDLAELGPALLAADAGRDVTDAVERVRDADVVLIATPQTHGSYTGLLKVFLDRLPELGLGRGVAVPMAAVPDLRNGRNIEEDLRVLLSDLGAWVLEPALLLAATELADPAEVIGAWAEVAAPALGRAVAVSA
ncbi:NAD(P)H-dependent oxidoreductase [Nocardiopsis sp. RSe5-2]|uniref:NAD(P)H-dependent oxidoreductase n=1 Tax=Nocardiopsis endophytica TaxID=3018445 RepID=A0ABT4U023_9ACTN|nr:NAD(P)H-dependent oxidoreductase [Nocardiopsis endophytica]MDA2810302.1 NAD(P)H-dependent oxidoreductase [Nocardiopsis endophytica]